MSSVAKLIALTGHGGATTDPTIHERNSWPMSCNRPDQAFPESRRLRRALLRSRSSVRAKTSTESLRNQCERQFVFFVTEGSGQLLKKRFIASVIVDLGSDTCGFFLQAKLRGRVQHAAHALLRQIFQRRLTPARSGQRNICAESFG